MNTAGGKAVRQSAQMAVDEINARGGIGGRTITLVIKDDGGDSQKAIEAARELREIRAWWPLWAAAAFFADAESEAARRFTTEYQRRFGQPANTDAALGYDALQVVARALTGAGSDRVRIREYLEQVGRRHPAVEGVTGTIRFDATATCRPRRWPSGWCAATRWSAPTPDAANRYGRHDAEASPPPQRRMWK